MTSREPILAIKDLTVDFDTEDGIVHAVTRSATTSSPARCSESIGESGSGKSVSVMSVLGLIPSHPGRIGRARRSTRASATCSSFPKEELQKIRGGEIAMIFQDPMTSLNPVFRRRPDRGGDPGAQRRGERGRARSARDRAARRSSAFPNPEARIRPVPARVLGRHAPARHDRDGDRQRAVDPDRRRADDGARRDDPGADHRGACRPLSARPTPRRS